MKGFRVVFTGEKDLNDYLSEVEVSTLIDLNYVQQSESDYATIFFLEESGLAVMWNAEDGEEATNAIWFCLDGHSH